MAPESQRMLWCDFARVAAALMVVLIHVSAKWFENYGRIPNLDWQLANILDSAAREAVPWFFMLSGLLLLQRKPASFATYIRRRFLRVMGPFVLFSALGALAAVTIGPRPASWNVLLDPTYYHLWFFYPLLVFYLLAYFIVPPATNPWLALGVCYVVIAVDGGGLARLGFRGFSIGSESTFAYLLYGVAGHYAGRVPIRRWTGPLCLALFVASVAALAVLTSRLSHATGFGNESQFAYTTLPVATAAFAGFIGLRCLEPWLERAMGPISRSLVLWLSGFSLAIYGLHAFVLQAIWKEADGQFLGLRAASGLPLLVLIVLALSLAVAVPAAALDRRGLLLGVPARHPGPSRKWTVCR